MQAFIGEAIDGIAHAGAARSPDGRAADWLAGEGMNDYASGSDQRQL